MVALPDMSEKLLTETLMLNENKLLSAFLNIMYTVSKFIGLHVPSD